MMADERGPIVSKPQKISLNFHLVTMNAGLSTVGSSALSLAIIWIALAVTNNPIITGFADGMGAVPLFLSFAFGAYVDSLFSKKLLSIVASVMRAGVVLALVVSLVTSSLVLQVISIYSVAFVVGLTSDILNSTRASWTKQFLTEEQYKSGSALMQSATSLGQAVGFVAAGVLILFGLQFAIYSFALILAVSIIPIAMLKNERLEIASNEKSIGSSILNGFKYIFSKRALKATILISLVANLAFGTLGILMAYQVEETFSLSAIYFTGFFLALTLGIFSGSALGSKIKGKIGPYALVLLIGTSIMLVMIGFFQDIYLDFPFSFAIGVLVGITNVMVMTSIVKIVDQEMMGRTMGAINTFAISMTFLSGAIGGVLIAFFTIVGSFYFIAVIIALTVIGPLYFKEFYNLTI